jgi:uncharacterized membrane protein YqaE (UPF0057 family)
MKTLRPILAFALITTLLASCSTSNDVVGGIFQKRKYNKGFYWNRNSGTPHDKGSDVARKYETEDNKSSDIRLENTTVSTLEKKQVEVPVNNSQPVSSQAAVSEKVNENSQSSSAVNTEKSAASSKKSTVNYSEAAPSGKRTKSSFSTMKKKLVKSTSKSSDGTSDVALILLVILAIIIPPLAVLLYEGASGRFVIVLILWLLAIFGFFLSPIAGLLYLIAMIYALIIVLGR